MSIAACPSMRPASPRSACARAASISFGRRTARSISTSSRIMIGPPTNSAAINCQPRKTAQQHAQLDHQVGRSKLERHRRDKVRTLAKQRPRQRRSRIGAGRRSRAQRRRLHNRPSRRVRHQLAHLRLRYHGLHHRRQQKSQAQRPQNLPGHDARHLQRFKRHMQHSVLPLSCPPGIASPLVRSSSRLDGPASTLEPFADNSRKSTMDRIP